MVMATLEGFIAFREKFAQEVEAKGRLVPQTFGMPFKWVPFADTSDGAIEKAFRSTKGTNPEVATQPTSWCVLHVVLSAEQCVEAFKSGRLMRPTLEPPGWRFYGDIELGEGNAFEWAQCTIAPIGLMPWAEKALSTWYEIRAAGDCMGCGACNTVTWTAMKKQQKLYYCAACWNSFFLREEGGAPGGNAC